MSPINERQWQGRVLVAIDRLIREHPEWGFSRVDQEVEVPVKGQRRKYTDPLIYDADNRPVCLIELKLPDREDGRSPRYLPVIESTYQKASYLGAPYWLTWNVNSAVLWRTEMPGRPPHERSVRQYDVTAIRSSEELDRPDVSRQIEEFLRRLLADLYQIYVGVTAAVPQPLDESFVHTIQTYIDPLLVGILEAELAARYRSDADFAGQLRRWAVDEQGWTWDDSPGGLPHSLGRTTRLACSMLVNKLVFYEAMRKVYGLPALMVPDSVRTGEQLRQRLQSHFDLVRQNIDYESIFTDELLDRIPFLSDDALELWRDLIRDITRFDFTNLDYDVIGAIFQRLIAPDERHKLGQYFTPSRVVDLINTFCIRRPDVRVLDPGCGAGTFLVRAYSRLKRLNPDETHEERLNRLWGIDIARYPAHLSTINLASRDFSSWENYPRIIRDDFFNVIPLQSQYEFHRRRRGGSLEVERIDEHVPKFHAVVGNPPYTRQEEMEDLYSGMRDRARRVIHAEWQVDAPRRASLHALFLLHAAAFLEEGGRLGFLMHSSWVDVDYGSDIQQFLLDHFKILAVIEPQVEHWFPEPDVNTSILVVERCHDREARARNKVRFVQVRVPLSELVTSVGGDPDDPGAYETVVQEICSAEERVQTPYWRIVPVSQDVLWRNGLDDEGNYRGSKWGTYLRAPDVFVTILAKANGKLVPLGNLVKVSFALKTGANDFFYVKDVTDKLNSQELAQYGLTPPSARRLRVIETDDGQRFVVEARYLKPILTTTRRVDMLEVQPAWITHRVLMVDNPRRLGQYVREYIRLGETRTFGSGDRAGVPALKETCRQRDPWFVLDSTNRGPLLWFMNLSNLHVVPRNPNLVYADARFYNLTPRNPEMDDLIFGILNSTFTFLCAEMYGRQFAGRGMDSIDIKVYEVEQIPIVDPATVPSEVAEEIKQAVQRLCGRRILRMPDELREPDRRALDRAVLKAMGFTEEDERERVLEQLYDAVTERIAIRRTRALSSRQYPGIRNSVVSAAALADELMREIAPSEIRRFPNDFLPSNVQTVELQVSEASAFKSGEEELEGTTDDGKLVSQDPDLREFLEYARTAGVVGRVKVPSEPRILRDALDQYRRYVTEMESRIDRLVSSRTRNRSLARRIRQLMRERLGLAPIQRQGSLF